MPGTRISSRSLHLEKFSINAGRHSDAFPKPSVEVCERGISGIRGDVGDRSGRLSQKPAGIFDAQII